MQPAFSPSPPLAVNQDYKWAGAAAALYLALAALWFLLRDRARTNAALEGFVNVLALVLVVEALPALVMEVAKQLGAAGELAGFSYNGVENLYSRAANTTALAADRGRGWMSCYSAWYAVASLNPLGWGFAKAREVEWAVNEVMWSIVVLDYTSFLYRLLASIATAALTTALVFTPVPKARYIAAGVLGALVGMACAAPFVSLYAQKAPQPPDWQWCATGGAVSGTVEKIKEAAPA
ncbi:MAG: hypothetical protein B7L53_09765, partial [Thermofilum sp. NZ13]